MAMEGINGQSPVPNVPPGDRGAGRAEGQDADAPRGRGARDAARRREGDAPADRRAVAGGGRRELPTDAPGDIDPRIWQAMDADERRHFASVEGLEGPLTYGPGGPSSGGESESTARRGLHLDVRA